MDESHNQKRIGRLRKANTLGVHSACFKHQKFEKSSLFIPALVDSISLKQWDRESIWFLPLMFTIALTQTLAHYDWGGLPACSYPLVLITAFLIKLNKRSPCPISLFSQSQWRLIPRVITITRLLTMSMFDETEVAFFKLKANILTHMCLRGLYF